MYLINYFPFLAVINLSSGWVFNNVDFPTVRRIGLDPESPDLNEVDTDGEDLREAKFSLIYPGTKWCGAGNDASDYDDLGPSRETDKCCREHDLCPDIISAGETKHNLTNNAFYTRLSCECDERFRSCLRGTGTKAAKQIGTIYFNALNTECFREDFPKVGCKRRGGWFNNKCLEPEYDTTRGKLYQWFDVPQY